MATATKTRTKIKKLTAKQRLDELQSFVSLCFIMLEGVNLKEIAHKTSLSTTTVHRLFNSEYTLAVRFGTIQALGIAAGLRLEMTKYQYKVVLMD